MHTFNREKYAISIKEYLTYSTGIILIMLGTLSYIWPNIKLLDLNYTHSKLEEQKAKLQKKNRLLKIEAESLKSLESIERAARNNGFYLPTKNQLVYVTGLE